MTRKSHPLFLAAVLVATIAVMVSIGCGPGKKPKVKRDGDDRTSASTEEKSRKQVQAKVGVGKQGRKLKNRDGLFATPVKALFNTREKLTLMNAERALQLFEGLNQRYPESHEEYMEKVIQANNITLPKLPEGDFYEYDVKKHTLMVWTQDE